MTEPRAGTVAVIDLGLGNLFSVMQACLRAGLRPAITSSPADVRAADIVILPGVGAFRDAMDTLHRTRLSTAVRETAAAGRPLIGICLGMQLFMSESSEFGRHEGLGLLEGDVVPLEARRSDGSRLKIPQVGWNAIDRGPSPWVGTLLEGVMDGAQMYFVHSYCVRPADPQVVLSTTTYGDAVFCSAMRQGNVIGMQFHPERSGSVGLQIYRTLAQYSGSTREPDQVPR